MARSGSRSSRLFVAVLAASAVGLVGLATGPSAGARAPDSPDIVLADSVPTTVTGSITAGDVDQQGRIQRDGFLRGCEEPTGLPGLFNSTPVDADSFSFSNGFDEERCILVEADFTGCGASTQVNAYSSYSPAAPGANVIGSAGNSTTGRIVFGFRAPASSPFVLVVHETTPGAGCPAYELTVHNLEMPTRAIVADGGEASDIADAVQRFEDNFEAGDSERITWEDVPESLAEPESLPGSFYRTTVPRGLQITEPVGVGVSSDGSGVRQPEFESFVAGSADRFEPFSGVRIFSPFSVPLVELAFADASGAAAPVAAFGAVTVGSSSRGALIPRDADGDPLGIFAGTDSSPNGFSFISVQYPDARIHALTASGDRVSGLVTSAFDDLIYGTPAPDCSTEQTRVDTTDDRVVAQATKLTRAERAVSTKRKQLKKARKALAKLKSAEAPRAKIRSAAKTVKTTKQKFAKAKKRKRVAAKRLSVARADRAAAIRDRQSCLTRVPGEDL